MARISPRLLAHLLVLPLLVPALPARAQTASLVADLTSQGASPGPSSQPSEFFAFGGKLLFSASQPGSGREPWVSDGLDRGTRLLADLCPGECDSNPQILGATATAVLGATHYEVDFLEVVRLWRSDGTRAGTYLLPSAADPVELPDTFDGAIEAASLGSALYVSGCNRGQGCGIWRSDGTPAGTRVVKVFDRGFGEPFNLAAAGGRLFFFQGGMLWVTDGTAGGTRTVKEAPDGARLPTGLGDKLFFLSADETSGQQLWVSDGTAAGTRAVTSFAAEEPFEQTLFLKALGGKLYFVADDVVHGAEIWATDGTPAGTRQVTEIGFHNPFNWDGFPFLETGLRATDLEVLGNRIVFWASDGIHGFGPWSTAGTPGSTTPLCPSCSFLDEGAALVKVGSRVLFTGRDAQHGIEVWATDGTPQGTTLLKDVCPGACDGARSEPLPLLGSAFFSASDGHAGALWISDGTPRGTRRFAAPGAYVDFDTRFRASVAALGSTVFFAGDGADDDYGVELWASDGTPAGTRLVTDIAGGNGSTQFAGLTAAGRNLFFGTCGSGSTHGLWYTEGTPESMKSADQVAGCGGFSSFLRASVGGALLFPRNEYFENRDQLWRMGADGTLTQLTQMPNGFRIGDLAALAGRVVFTVNVIDSQYHPVRDELWRSDGTVQGTVKVTELPASLVGPYFFTVVGSEIWFSVYDFDQGGGSEIWRTDGTAAGTRQAVDLGEGRTVTDPEFTQVGSTVYLVGADAKSQRQIWRSDGTPAGSAMVRDLDPTPDDDYSDAAPADLTAFQGALYFSARTPQGRSGLWRTDGTAQGTVLLKDFVDPGDFINDYGSEYWPSPLDLKAVGSSLVFAADDGHGRELWRSDGTAAGTTVLRDLRLTDQIDLSVGDTFFRPAAGRLYFTADDGLHGYELWQTDGTAAGTRLVQDLAPEGDSSYPSHLTVAGDRLFFSADDGSTGEELWVLPLGGAPCQPSAAALCLAGGRFEVKVAWRDFGGRAGTGHAVPLTGDTGYFWFFDAANVEAVVKVLDGTGTNGHFWVFFGALSSVEYTLTVTDTRTGAARRYFNPRGVLASVGDTQGFGPLGAYDTQAVAAAGAPPLVAERVTAATGSCVPATGRLCLKGGRFAVEASWKDFSNRTGTGTAVALTGDTGTFWFFDAANVEVVIKVLDGSAVNGRFWLFYGALSNVEYMLTVTDTMTGKVKTYANPKGRFASVADTGAF